MADSDSGCGEVIVILALVAGGGFAICWITLYLFIYLSGAIGNPLLLALGMVTLGALTGLLMHIRKHGTSDAGSTDNYANIMGRRFVPEIWALVVLSSVLVLLGLFRWIWFPTTPQRINVPVNRSSVPPFPIQQPAKPDHAAGICQYLGPIPSNESLVLRGTCTTPCYIDIEWAYRIHTDGEPYFAKFPGIAEKFYDSADGTLKAAPRGVTAGRTYFESADYKRPHVQVWVYQSIRR